MSVTYKLIEGRTFFLCTNNNNGVLLNEYWNLISFVYSYAYLSFFFVMRRSRSTAQHYGGECSLIYKDSNITTSHSFIGFAATLDLHMFVIRFLTTMSSVINVWPYTKYRSKHINKINPDVEYLKKFKLHENNFSISWSTRLFFLVFWI